MTDRQRANSIADLVQAHLSSPALIESTALETIDRIKRLDQPIGSIAHFDESFVMEQVEILKKSSARDLQRYPLLGVPVVVKDNICTFRLPTSCGSKVLEHYVSPYEATVIAKLRNAGAIIVAKSTCDEFAMGSSNETCATKVTRNPHDLKRVPGGSSGGSAAAIAAQIAPCALGSDTGGSIRQPSAFCGVTGFLPSYGTVSRFGLVAHASSLDQIGPIAGSVSDCERIWSVIKGADHFDVTTMQSEIERLGTKSRQSIKTIGIPEKLISNHVQPEIRKRFVEVCQKLHTQGYRTVEVDFPNIDSALSVYYIISSAEASTNLARYDGIRMGSRLVDESTSEYRSRCFGPEVKRRILMGAFVLSEGYQGQYYQKAMSLRSELKRTAENIFESQCDVLMLPTTPSTAFEIGHKKHDPVAMYLSDLFTVFVNLCGLPAMSVPTGFDVNRLPIGTQIVGPRFGDGLVFEYGKLVEASQ